MQFNDFFPRLKARASNRYGQVVTERQFKDWREDDLLPGPAAPKGKGRGQSPERHWPVASYRRALRICRYKAWEANRSSLWRIGFWLSGETIITEQLRKDFNRQLRTLRRSQRGFSESGRWLNSTFSKASDIESHLFLPRGSGAGWLRLFGISADQFRKQIASSFEELEGAADVDLINEIIAPTWGLGWKLDHDIRTYHRTGYLSDPGDTSGTFVDRAKPEDFVLCHQLRNLQRMVVLLGFQSLIAGEKRQVRPFLIHLIEMISEAEAFSVSRKVPKLLKILYEIDCDKRDGFDPRRRLEFLETMAQDMRSELQARISELRASGDISYIRPMALIADLEASIAAEKSDGC